MPSTRSSDSSPADGDTPRPSRAAIAVLVLASIAIPAGGLAVILSHRTVSANAPTPSTTVAPIDTRKARVGNPAPDFTLPATTGGTVTLSKLRGRPVVLAFFASWCRPCEEELPVLARFQREHSGLTVVAVNYQDLPSDTTAFVRRLHVTYPALLEDGSGPIARRYGVRGIPQTIFIDARGVVRGRVYGETSRRALAPAIDALLRGVDIPPV